MVTRYHLVSSYMAETREGLDPVPEKSSYVPYIEYKKLEDDLYKMQKKVDLAEQIIDIINEIRHGQTRFERESEVRLQKLVESFGTKVILKLENALRYWNDKYL